MICVLLTPVQNTQGLCDSLIADAQRTLTIRPLAWQRTDPLSHHGYVLELTDEELVELSLNLSPAGYTLLHVATTVEETLAAVGLCIV